MMGTCTGHVDALAKVEPRIIPARFGARLPTSRHTIMSSSPELLMKEFQMSFTSIETHIAFHG